MAATKNKQTVPKENVSRMPLDRELFADKLHEQMSEQEVFAGDQDFYKLLVDSPQATPTHRGWSSLIRGRHFSAPQKAIAAGIVVITAMLLYALLKAPPKPAADTAVLPDRQQAPLPETASDDSTQASPQTIEETESNAQSTQPLSLKVADTFYLQKNYVRAYSTYKQLHQSLLTNDGEKLLVDFLQLRMALCTRKTAGFDQAGRLFRTLLQSSSPVIRLFANYYLALIEAENGQYLKARTRAYQTIALIAAAELEKDWALTLQRDCYFIVAEATTRDVLSFRNADRDIPRDLWIHPVELDPFTNLEQSQLHSLLSRGSEQLSKGLLGPQIQKFERQGVSYWSVTCQGAPVDELLSKFAAGAGIDISWAPCSPAEAEETKQAVRKRPVSLCLPAVTMQEFVTVAAGHVGLLARLDEKGVLNIFDPADYNWLSKQLSLLTSEAVSLWQGFLLTFHDDQRIPNAHFALGLLQAQNGQAAEAIAEYKLVANRFSQTSLAPFALLNSSKLKAGLHDYSGAREDLKQLVEQYPDNELYGQACLHFADTTMKAGLWDEASRLYRKVYYLGLSADSQTASTFGAGVCCYEKQDYAGAAEWLMQYVKLAGNSATASEIERAYLLLGKTNLSLGKFEQACDAFQHTLTGQLSSKEYVETISGLVEARMQQGRLVEALEALEKLQSWQFPQHEYIEILLLRSKVIRSMGLAERAIAILGDRAEYLADEQLKMKVSFELAACSVAKGDLELARSKLVEILTSTEPGPFAHEAALTLADVCLKLGQDAQTISICMQLLDSGPSEQVKQKALNTLATAYQQQKNYDKAALALLGRWDRTKTQEGKQ